MAQYVDKEDLEDKDINVIPVRSTSNREIVEYVKREQLDETPLQVGDSIFHKGSKGDIYFRNTGKPHDFVDKIKDIKDGNAICETYGFAIKGCEDVGVFKIIKV